MTDWIQGALFGDDLMLPGVEDVTEPAETVVEKPMWNGIPRKKVRDA
jgi:hypothetical protein